MRHRTIRVAPPALALAALLAAPAAAHAQDGGSQKMTLAVQSFRYVGAGASRTPDAGGGYMQNKPLTPNETGILTDKFNTALVKSGKFIVIERARLQSILDEQGLGESGAVDPATAARIGKLCGARYYLLGSISVFAAGLEVKQIKGTTHRSYRTSGKMVIDLKFVDTETGEIVFADRADVIEQGDPKPTSGALPDLPAEYFDQLQRKTVEKAVCKVLDTLYPAKVMSVRGTTLFISRGDGGCINEGDQYDVFLQGEKLIDPDTGDVLGFKETKIAICQIDAVKPKFSQATVVQGDPSAIEKGMVCRKSTGDPVRPPPPPADTTPPSVTFVEPADGLFTGSSAVRCVVSVTDDRGVEEVLIGGSEALPGEGTNYAAVVTLRDGDNRIVAKARDAAGNWGEASITVCRDATPPGVEILAPKDGGRYNDPKVGVGVRVSGGDVAGVWVEGTPADPVPGQAGVYKASLVLRDGRHTITAKATDRAGNEGTASVTIEIDSTAPSVTAKATVKVNGRVDDPSSTVTVNGRRVQVNPDGTWEIEIKLPPDKKVVIEATDAFGNTKREVLDYSK